jgi:hypothetical protein
LPPFSAVSQERHFGFVQIIKDNIYISNLCFG